MEALQVLLGTVDGSSSPAEWNQVVINAVSPIQLAGVDLSGHDLSQLSFDGCVLDGANFSECGLGQVSFQKASLVEVCFRQADLRRASFRSANAESADFSNAQLDGADLSWCNVRDACFKGVNLAQTRLWKTDLRGAEYPPFTPSSRHDFLSEEFQQVSQSAQRIPLAKLLMTLGGMIGTPYRLKGVEGATQVPLPAEMHEDPLGCLVTVLSDLDLRANPKTSPDGELLFYEVVNKIPTES